MTHHEPTRRALIAASAAAPLAAVPALALAAPGDDAELSDLFRQWRTAVDYANSVTDMTPQAEVDRRCNIEVAIFQRLLRTPARSPEGFKVKLDALAKLKDWEAGDPADEELGLDEQAISAVLADAERLFGRAVA